MLKGVAVDESILFFCFCFFPLETTGVALIFLCMYVLRYARGEKYLDSAASTAEFMQFWKSLLTILVRFRVPKDFVCDRNFRVQHH